jgi:hypothetical protein
VEYVKGYEYFLKALAEGQKAERELHKELHFIEQPEDAKISR